MADLSISFGGLELRNPILSASGTFGHGAEMRFMTPPETLGGLVGKSVSLRPRAGNPAPRICETRAGFLNSIGLENRGVDAYCRDVLPTLLGVDTIVITNIAGETVEEFEALAARLESEAAVDAIEVNLSCPNVQGGKLPFSTDPRTAEDVIRRVRRATTKTVIAKLSPNVTRIAEIGRACEGGGADAVTCTNTVLGMSVDWRTRKPGLATGMGGYSGPAVKPIALRCAWECVDALTIPVIGCGGIETVDDVLEFIVVGCRAVQVGTACFADPSLPATLAGQLAARLESVGVHSISELTGTLHWPGRPASAPGGSIGAKSR